MELQTEPERYFQLVQEMKQAVLETTNGYMKVGEILEIMFQSKLYRYSGFERWIDFINDTCKMSVSGADHARRLYRKFNGLLEGKDIPYTRLLEMAPIANEENMESLLEKAQNYPARGWKDVILEMKGELPSEECLHETTINVCVKCHKRIS